MKKISIFLVIVFTTFGMCISHAAIVNTGKTKITKLYAYDDFGGGDVAIFLATGLTECPGGVYLTPNAPGYKTLVSFALTAYTSGKNVLFQVYNDRIWTGGPQLCQVDAIRLE